jgi:hypothetical protein
MVRVLSTRTRLGSFTEAARRVPRYVAARWDLPKQSAGDTSYEIFAAPRTIASAGWMGLGVRVRTGLFKNRG